MLPPFPVYITFMKSLFLGIIYLIMTFQPAYAQHALQTQIEELLIGEKAQVGVAVIINGMDTVTVNNDIRYPMMSVFKFHQALAVANYLQGKHISLQTEIFIPHKQMRPDTYSLLKDRFPEGNISLPIYKLLEYTLQLSDNNACDILFDYIGGTGKAERYIRSLSCGPCEFPSTEADMHRNLDLCYGNWTTPLASAVLLEKFLNQTLFDEELQHFIYTTMTTCQTGEDRLAKPLKGTGAIIGHKTGTSDRNLEGLFIGVNDIGFVLLPDGRHYTIAVYVKDSPKTLEETSQLIADISEAAYNFVQNQ